MKFRCGQYQLRIPFVLYADFGNTLKLVDEQYRKKINEMNIEHKGKIAYVEKGHHTCNAWMVTYIVRLLIEMSLAH